MLPIHEYLKYNNVALIDLSQEFHANCADQYQKKGYLSPKQLARLRGWCHSAETIDRLVSTSDQSTTTPNTFTTPFDEPVVSTATRARWTPEDDQGLKNVLTFEPTADELIAEFPERTIASLKARIYKLGGFYRKGKFYLP